MASYCLIVLVALLGFVCVSASSDADKLETLLKSLELEVASPKLNIASPKLNIASPAPTVTHTYAPYPFYPAYYPGFAGFAGFPVFGGIHPDALIHHDLNSRNQFLSEQLDAAHGHIQGLKQAHDNHRQAHETTVERLEADIAKGREQQAQLLVQIESLNKTINSITEYSNLKSQLITELVRLVIGFQRLNVKLYADIRTLHQLAVVSENKHHEHIVELQDALEKVHALLTGFETESAEEVNKSKLVQQNYQEDEEPKRATRMALNAYMTLKAMAEEKNPNAANYFAKLLKKLKPLVAPYRH